MKKRAPIAPVQTQAMTHNGQALAPLPYAWEMSAEFGPLEPIRRFRLRLVGPETPLRVYINEPKDAVFVVVRGAIGHWEVAGWIHGGDALDSRWRVPGRWFEIPQRELRPMAELDGREALFDESAMEGSP